MRSDVFALLHAPQETRGFLSLERARDVLYSLYPAILMEGYLILRDCES
jgi:hypothetical protein